MATTEDADVVRDVVRDAAQLLDFCASSDAQLITDDGESRPPLPGDLRDSYTAATGRHCLTSADTETGVATHNPVLAGTESTDLIAEQRTLNSRVRRRRSRNRLHHDLACDSRTTPATH